MQCILCKIIFGKFFTSTIIWYAFLYALQFAQKILFLQKVGVTTTLGCSSLFMEKKDK
jgi:hypothetical protein